jgi:N utilization substance protein B
MVNSSRRQGREAALQALYLVDLCQMDLKDLPSAIWSEEPLAQKTREFAEHLANGVLSRWERIDKLVSHYAKNWELKRMASVDRCILRLATGELLMDVDTPVSVIINEAVEIAKRYSTSESSKFVNGILDKIKEERNNKD